MKLIAALLALAASAHATPYFRVIDAAHPQPVIGALIAPDEFGQTEAASLLPLVTHSPKDGCLLPSIVCENWTPLAVGASMNAGKATLAVAPLFNVMPWVQSAVESAAPNTIRFIQDPAVEISAGPVWEYKQLTNKGYFRVFTGLALHF